MRKALLLAGLAAALVAGTSCHQTTLHKGVTEEKSADGSVKRIESESASQTISTSEKLRLEKLNFGR
jgi:hypothetical protein